MGGGFGVQGPLGIKQTLVCVWGLGCRVWNWGLGHRDEGFESKDWRFGIRNEEFWVQG